ncbi:CoA pyrophosphatase [Paenalkalicoccus suaedae]|uniref:CoA pyrophosphatase n=2 Tax=Paenalkalicoccus suaedae TaxID=2592382 RepID=A0A859FEZ5_9BACI|nr:CoA pyrophosphatase [Paenalkalicoccus suaedae]
MKIDGSYHLVFEVRSEHVSQPGEICFPGGRIDPEDPSARSAAGRELEEELGLHSEDYTILGELDYLVMQGRSIMHVFIGEINETAIIKADSAEVEEIFTVPVDTLLQMRPDRHHINLEFAPSEEFPFHLIPNGKDYPFRGGRVNELFYEYQGYVIWGLTARILKHALQELSQAT